MINCFLSTINTICANFNLEKAIKGSKNVKAEDVASIYNAAKRAGVNSTEALAKFIKNNVSIMAK